MARHYLDFVGLNTFIYEPVGWDENEFDSDFLGEYENIYGPLVRPALLIDHGRKVYLSQNTIGAKLFKGGSSANISGLWKSKNYLFSPELPTTASFFPALMLKRNGPYGFPTWKQIRISENSLSRRQRKENVFTFVKEPGEEFVFNNNGRLNTLRAKYGAIQKYTENPVSSRFKPFVVGGATIVDDGTLERFEIVGSYGNETLFFNNEEINKYYNKRMVRSKQYETVKDFYLNGGLDKDGSPLDSFEFLKYGECVYPPRVYQYKNYVRQRITFHFPWKDKRSDRTEINPLDDDGFISEGGSRYKLLNGFLSQSIWPLDANINFESAFITGSEDRMYYYGRPYDLDSLDSISKDFGILQNTWSTFSSGAFYGMNYIDHLFAPLYARKHMLTSIESCNNISGMEIEGVNTGTSFGDIPETHLPCGEVKWEAHTQSGLKPFYDSYQNFIEEARQAGKEYSIIPEFRISEHVETYLEKGLTEDIPELFSLTGGLLRSEAGNERVSTNSSNEDFYKIYSTSDFMKHFEVIKQDHKEFVPPNSISLKCKAIKKLLPYEGFYPAQRTVDLAKQFVSSYLDKTVYQRDGDANIYTASLGFQHLMTPMFAPGVLFNSIKSGIACDYPIIRDNVSSELTAISAFGYLVMPTPQGGVNSGVSDILDNNGNPFYYGDWVYDGFNDGTTGDDRFKTNSFVIEVPSGSLLDIGAPGYDSLRIFNFVQSGAFGGISNGDPITDNTFTGGATNGYYTAVVVNATSSWNDVTQAISGAIAIALSGTVTTEIDSNGVKLFQTPGTTGNISSIPDLGFGTNPAIASSEGWTLQNSPSQLSIQTFRGGTDPIYALNNSSSAGFNSGSIFDQRIPFEALVEPEKYLSDVLLYGNEPHPSGNVGTACLWSGEGSELYRMMASNFAAEVPSFFLKDGSNTTIQSLPSNDPSIGNVISGRKYRMRVRTYKTTQRRTPSRTIGGESLSDVYYAPQYKQEERETFTMYSRPTAFGPPSIFYDENDTIVNNPSLGENYPFTPPYYHGESWADITFIPTESRKYTIQEIINSSSVEYYRYLEDGTSSEDLPSDESGLTGLQFLNTTMNKNAMQLDASFNIFSLDEEKENNVLDPNNVPSRWTIQTKFETPILNFSHLTSSNSIALPSEGSGSTARGMWHQYGLLEDDSNKGIFVQVTNIPHNFRKQLLDEELEDQYSLVDLCGFSTEPQRLGEVADEKKIHEAVIAVPFIEEEGQRKFFRIPRVDIQRAVGEDEQLVGRSIKNMVTKMQRYVMPPSMDFLNNETIDPFAMYIFEFSHTLKKQDLANIWQNLYPEIGQTFETAESSISHELLAHELLGGGAQLTPEGTLDVNANGNEIPNKVRWMVFKVKQRAETNYYNKIIGKKQNLIKNTISYNWPYDFFSLVELAKIESEVKFAEREIKPDQQPRETIVPKISKKAGSTTNRQELRDQGRAAAQAIRSRRTPGGDE